MPWDVYTTLLLVALVALCISVLLLILEMGRYNWDISGTSSASAAEQIRQQLPAEAVRHFAAIDTGHSAAEAMESSFGGLKPLV